MGSDPEGYKVIYLLWAVRLLIPAVTVVALKLLDEARDENEFLNEELDRLTGLTMGTAGDE